jgi:hypothetical protein
MTIKLCSLFGCSDSPPLHGLFENYHPQSSCLDITCQWDLKHYIQILYQTRNQSCVWRVNCRLQFFEFSFCPTVWNGIETCIVASYTVCHVHFFSLRSLRHSQYIIQASRPARWQCFPGGILGIIILFMMARALAEDFSRIIDGWASSSLALGSFSRWDGPPALEMGKSARIRTFSKRDFIRDWIVAASLSTADRTNSTARRDPRRLLDCFYSKFERRTMIVEFKLWSVFCHVSERTVAVLSMDCWTNES